MFQISRRFCVLLLPNKHGDFVGSRSHFLVVAGCSRMFGIQTAQRQQHMSDHQRCSCWLARLHTGKACALQSSTAASSLCFGCCRLCTGQGECAGHTTIFQEQPCSQQLVCTAVHTANATFTNAMSCTAHCTQIPCVIAAAGWETLPDQGPHAVPAPHVSTAQHSGKLQLCCAPTTCKPKSSSTQLRLLDMPCLSAHLQHKSSLQSTVLSWSLLLSQCM